MDYEPDNEFPCRGCTRYADMVRDLKDEVSVLRARQVELLQTIYRLSVDAINPAEAEEMRAQIAVLIAEVGTVRSASRYWNQRMKEESDRANAAQVRAEEYGMAIDQLSDALTLANDTIEEYITTTSQLMAKLKNANLIP